VGWRGTVFLLRFWNWHGYNIKRDLIIQQISNIGDRHLIPRPVSVINFMTYEANRKAEEKWECKRQRIASEKDERLSDKRSSGLYMNY
jgi:uncharacterized protein (DUF1919 family)